MQEKGNVDILENEIAKQLEKMNSKLQIFKFNMI